MLTKAVAGNTQPDFRKVKTADNIITEIRMALTSNGGINLLLPRLERLIDILRKTNQQMMIAKRTRIRVIEVNGGRVWLKPPM